MNPLPQSPLSTTELSPGLSIRGFAPPLRLSDFKLIAFDMDSTLINIECIDEIADAVGRKADVAAITEATMRGEITDFKESLRRRVALLGGVTVDDMEQVYAERLRLNPGAAHLVAACKDAGMKVLLVSGGFTFFADRVRDTLGIDFVRANVLELKTRPRETAPNTSGDLWAEPSESRQLTGRLVTQSWGDICDGAEKRRTVLEVASLMGIDPAQAIAVGDGANDLSMMGAVGLSVAYHAKPKVREQAMVSITEGGLDRLLEVFAG